jgi:predicted DNA-binding protein (MmcQ/YjbR family)
MTMTAKAAEAALINYAMTFPGAWKDFPWDHTVVKVGKKVFVFFGGEAAEPDTFSMTVKLPISAEMALTLPWVSKAGHGLWKAGWVNASEKTGADFDLDTRRGWIDQSYRAVAPKKLVKQLDAAA